MHLPHSTAGCKGDIERNRRGMQLVIGEVLMYGLLSAQGQASDIAIQAEEILKLKRTLNELLSMHTGQPLATVGKMTVCLL